MNEIPKPEVLFNFSDTTLQALLMASLDRESRLIKAAKESWQAAVREEAIALVAEWFLKHKAEIAEQAGIPVDVREVA